MIRQKANFTPMNERLRQTHVRHQHDFYSQAAKRAYETTLLASGITAVIYSQLNVGTRCTCSGSGSISLLNEQGVMHQSTIDRVLQNQSVPNERVEFNADDLNYTYADESNTGLGEDLPDDDEELIDFGGFNQANCALCFGSGYVGGFQLIGGYHACLNNPQSTDFERNTSNRPNQFENGTYATFETLVPLIPDTKVAVRLWHKDEQITEFTASPLVQGVPGTLQINTEHTFTHVEISVIPIKGLPIDFDQVEELFGPDMMNDKLTVDINLPDVGITRYSIIRDSKFKRCWQVTNINPVYNSHKDIIYLTCTCRLVGQNELFYQLMV